MTAALKVLRNGNGTGRRGDDMAAETDTQKAINRCDNYYIGFPAGTEFVVFVASGGL